MTIYVGGLRARLIRDSLYNMVRDSLDELGWFDSGRQHRPVSMIPEAIGNDTEIQTNVIALDDDVINTLDVELGSNLGEHSWDLVFDVYAESSALGIQLAVDIRDILQGRFASINRVAPVLDVYDYTAATPSVIFRCDMENIGYDRARSVSKPWQKYWYMVFVTIVDEYDNDSQGGDIND